MIFVTHDQTEAMTLGQRLCVLDQGRVMQVGAPMDLYQRPAHRLVGDFIGTPGMNLSSEKSVAKGRRSSRRRLMAVALAAGALGQALGQVCRSGGCAGYSAENVRLAENGAGFPVTLETTETLGHGHCYTRTAGHSLILRTAGLGRAKRWDQT